MMPEGKQLRMAVKWISDQLHANEDAEKKQLIREAIQKYDLSPIQAEYLYSFYKNKN
jgi:nitrate reductase assembly molybdenum cofactor insertion protein NarJ